MKRLSTILAAVLLPFLSMASEADLVIPELTASQNNLLYLGFIICFLGLLFGWYQYAQVKKIRAHQSMLDVANVIFQTCKTYLVQQGKFLVILIVII